MLSKVTFGVMDPIDVYNLLVQFFGVINCDERVLYFYLKFFAQNTKK